TGSLFFQAEDGIRDRNVTGVQTCALPISKAAVFYCLRHIVKLHAKPQIRLIGAEPLHGFLPGHAGQGRFQVDSQDLFPEMLQERSEERRVGKGWRWRYGPEQADLHYV